MVMAGFFSPHSPSFQTQEPQRHQSQGHVVVPTNPASDFVMIQPSVTVASLEKLFDAVALPLDLDQFRQRHLWPGLAQSIVDFLLTYRTDHHQPFLWSDPVSLPGTHSDAHRVDFQRPLLPRTHRQPHPPRSRLTLGPRIDSLEWNFTLTAAPI